MKISIKTKYEALTKVVNDYVSALKSVKTKTAVVLPAYGQPGKDDVDSKNSPNVVFIKDLITQVMTAKSLGYRTELYSEGSTLLVKFVEKTPPVPFALQYLP